MVTYEEFMDSSRRARLIGTICSPVRAVVLERGAIYDPRRSLQFGHDLPHFAPAPNVMIACSKERNDAGRALDGACFAVDRLRERVDDAEGGEIEVKGCSPHDQIGN